MNIVLITLDALSAPYMDIYNHDHCSPLFTEKARTPILRELLKDAVLYPRCYTNSNMTIVACRELLEARMASLPWEEKCSASLPFSDTNLVNVLRSRGVQTGSLLGSGSIWVFEGFLKEFHEGVNTAAPFKDVIDRSITWIKKNSSPFFFWTHSKDTHMGFNDNYLKEDFGYEKLVESFNDFNPDDFICMRQADVSKNLMLAYANSITACDIQIGRLIDHLKESGIYDDTMIIISADHGSSYGDLQSKHFAHHSSAHENIFNIPLIVKYAHSKNGGTTNSGLCQSLDIPYTILSELGIEIPYNWEGESLLNLTKKYVLMECNPGNRMWGVKTNDWICQYMSPKFWENCGIDDKPFLDSMVPFLYNVNNPLVNVYDEYPDIVMEIKNIIGDHYKRFLERPIT